MVAGERYKMLLENGDTKVLPTEKTKKLLILH